MSKNSTILMTGGGTLGPVTPLIAIAQEWQQQDPNVRVEWVGTPDGPERDVVTSRGYGFTALSAPKLSRHKWWTWVFIAPHLFVSCILAFKLLKQLQPAMVFSAGGFTSVPIAWMARLQGIPVWVHQLDVAPGLANRLMAPVAKRISVTWDESASAFPQRKTQVVGGMVRKEVLQGQGDRFLREEKLDPARPTLLVLGGGTGAVRINEAMEAIAPELVERMNVVHLTGRHKMSERLETIGSGYVAIEFLNKAMPDALAAATLVVARAGMGTILEIVALKKPCLLLPIPGSHQEKNAQALLERSAARVLSRITPQLLKQEIEKFIFDPRAQKEVERGLQKAIPLGAEKRIVQNARELI